MFKSKFGFVPQKWVEFDGEILKLGKFEMKKQDIKLIYFRPFDFLKNEWGSVYFSTDGTDYSTDQLFAKNMFRFTKKQTDSAIKLIQLMEIEVINPNEISIDSTPYLRNEKESHITISCPSCKSINVEFLQNDKKSFSVGKAAAGAALTGGIGTLAGFAGKKGNNQWHCKNCGQLFETKK